MKRATQKLPTGNVNSNAQLRWQICPQHPACLKSPQIQQFTSSQRVCLFIVTSHCNLSLHQPPSPQHPEAISLHHLGIPVGIIFRAILANLEELPIELQGDLFLFHTYTKWQGKWDGIFNGFFPRKHPTPKLWEKNVANCDTSWIEVTIGCQLHGDANLQIGGTTLHVQLPRPVFLQHFKQMSGTHVWGEYLPDACWTSTKWTSLHVRRTQTVLNAVLRP